MKLDDEIRLFEERVIRTRIGLGETAQEFGDRARDAVASPRVLAAAVALGYVLGTVTRGSRKSAAPRRADSLAAILMGAVWSLVRMNSGAAIQTLWNRVFRPRGTESRSAPAAQEGLQLNPGATRRLLPPNRSPL